MKSHSASLRPKLRELKRNSCQIFTRTRAFVQKTWFFVVSKMAIVLKMQAIVLKIKAFVFHT
jgi:hypothetical protein